MSQNDVASRPKLRGVIHLIGTLIALPCVIWLTTQAVPGSTTTATGLYGVCLVLLLGVSATYHTIAWSPSVYAVLKRVDRSMIFLFIGGSYTPFLSVCPGTPADIGIPLMWTASILGVLKTVFWTRPNRWFTAVPYVVIGWLGLPFIPAIYDQTGGEVLGLIAAGGLIYTVGAVVYARRWPNPYPTIFGFHEVFHCLVLLAAAAHYIAIWMIVVP